MIKNKKKSTWCKPQSKEQIKRDWPYSEIENEKLEKFINYWPDKKVCLMSLLLDWDPYIERSRFQSMMNKMNIDILRNIGKDKPGYNYLYEIEYNFDYGIFVHIIMNCKNSGKSDLKAKFDKFIEQTPSVMCGVLTGFGFNFSSTPQENIDSELAELKSRNKYIREYLAE